MRSLQTRRLTAAAVAVPVLLSLAIGGAGSAQSPGAPAPDTSITGNVTFWNGYAADGAEITTFTDQVLPAFQAQYPKITVNHQEIPYDDLRQKLVTGIAGGTLPDVLRSDITWVPEFADQDVLLPLDQEMSDFADIAAGVFPGPLSTNKSGDHYYGLPLDTNTRVLFANKDVLAKAGITKLPTTIDEFETMLKTVKDKLGPDVFGYAEGGTGAWSVLPWIWSLGGGITTDDLSTAQGVLNGPGTVAAVTKLKEWLDAGYLSPSILGGGTQTSDQFGNGQSATIVEGPWMPGIFANQFPNLKFDYAPIPAGPGGSTSVVGGEDIVVFNTTQNKDAALAFTRFMLSEEAQRMMGTTGQMPVLSSLTNDPALPAFFSTFQEQLATAKARTPVPSWSGIDEAISNGVLSALRGEVPIQDALDAAATTVDGLLKK